jgi:tetratricopeptide (TPR) repeat protein
LHLWDLDRGTALIRSVEGSLPIDSFNKLKRPFSPDSRRVFAAGQVFEAETGRPILDLRAAGSSSVLSVDGRRIVSWSDYGTPTVRVWDSATGRPITPPIRHGERVIFARFDPRARLLFTIAERLESGVTKTREARIWDASTGEPVSPPILLGQGAQGSSPVDLAFSIDGQSALFLFARSGPIRLDLAPTRLPLEDLMATARLLSSRRIDDTGGLVPTDLAESWKPDVQRPASVGNRSWLRGEALASAAAFDPFAVASNLDRAQAIGLDLDDLIGLRAEAKRELGDDRQAVLDATRSIEARDDRWDVRRTRAQALGALKRWDEALIDCQAVPRVGLDWHFDVFRATVFAELGLVARAGEALEHRYRGHLQGTDEQDVQYHLLPELYRQEDRGMVLLVATLLGRNRRIGKDGKAYLEAVLPHFDDLLKRNPPDALARRYVMLGRIGLAEHHTVFGERKEAATLLDRAATLAGSLDRTSVDDRYVLGLLANAWSSLGDEAEKADEAALTKRAYESARLGYEELATALPTDDAIASRLAWTIVNLGNLIANGPDVDRAIVLYQEASAIWTRLEARSPKDRVVLHGRWYAIERQAAATEKQGHFEEARRLFLEARTDAGRVLSELEESKPKLSDIVFTMDYHHAQENIAYLCKRLASLSRKMDDHQAVRAYRAEAVAIDEKLLTLSPHGPDEREETIESHVQLAEACETLKDWPAAREQYQRAVSLAGESIDYSADRFRADNTLADLHHNLALVAREMGDGPAAHAAYEANLRSLDDALKHAKDDRQRAEGHANLAWFLATVDHNPLRDGKRAVSLAAVACELTRQENFFCLAAQAAAHAESGDLDEATRCARKLVEKSMAKSDRRTGIFQGQLKELEAGRPLRFP